MGHEAPQAVGEVCVLCGALPLRDDSGRIAAWAWLARDDGPGDHDHETLTGH
jgi:hypothetical protein